LLSRQASHHGEDDSEKVGEEERRNAMTCTEKGNWADHTPISYDKISPRKGFIRPIPYFDLYFYTSGRNP
jgi:hypothetical protein